MSGMSMGGMGGMGEGMDMGSQGLFGVENMGIAYAYWYLVAAVVGVLVLMRVASFVKTSWSVRQMRRRPNAVPSKPRTWWAQIPATIQTIFREATYPQIWQFRGRFSKHFSFMPTGRWLLLGGYWTMLLVMLWENALLDPSDPLFAYYWEKVGFRAAWVSVTQVPFIFMLSCKLNIVSLLTGISYERLQWFHRWAGRTIFFTIIVHWSFFFNEWSIASFVQFEFQMMPMVYYGFGAWSVVGWMVLTSISFFRDLCYELFVLQHLAAAGAFLWLIYIHVPGYATYNVWFSIAFVAFDQIGRAMYSLYQNTHFAPGKGKRNLSFGYKASLEALPDGFTRVIVKDVAFKWKAGQHIYLSAPTVGVLEAHPFTVANDAGSSFTSSRDLTLLLKAHGGFTKRLWNRANRASAARTAQKPLHVFLSGPWGAPPDLRAKETLCFISSATGATFTVPLLQQLSRQDHCTRSVHFWWIVRTAEQLRWFREQIEEAAQRLQDSGVAVAVHFVVTCQEGAHCGEHPGLTETASGCCSSSDEKGACCGGSGELKSGAQQGGGGCCGGRQPQQNSCCSPPTAEKNQAAANAMPTNVTKALSSPFSEATDSDEEDALKSPGTVQLASCCAGSSSDDDDDDDEKSLAAAKGDCYTLASPRSEKPTTGAATAGCCCSSSSTSASPKLSRTSSASTTVHFATPTDPPTLPLSLPTPAAQAQVQPQQQLPLPPPPQQQQQQQQTTCSPNCLCPLLRHASSSSASLAEGGSCVCLHSPRARPALDRIIRPAVEEARGETQVVCCGGAGLVADVRNYVAALSDERAVHKGSGAQGLGLWAERYDW